MSYKFRAECAHDIEVLSKTLASSSVPATVNALQDKDGPDVEAVITTSLSLDELRSKMAKVPDGHVMVQTVRPDAEYDGIRNYDL